MIGRRMKHARRYQEIITAFLRNGFGYMVKDLGLIEAFSVSIKKAEKAKTGQSQRSLGERVRTLLEELGTTFIKLGQIASTRRDIFPEHIIQELEKLQNRVPPFPFPEVAKTIETELGSTIEGVFKEFDEHPVASASIGQVHQAVLHSGEKVAVKIQRPNIRTVIETDLEILYDLARLMDARFEWARTYRITDMIDEFSKSLQRELDFTNEGRNAERIKKQFHNTSFIHIPTIYWDYSTKKILTMEYIDGIKITDIQTLTEKKYDRKKVAEKLAHSFLQQILVEGFFHGDPHPGNVVIMSNEVIGLIDFGIVGRLSPEMKYQFVNLIVSLKRGDTDAMVKGLLQMGLFPENTDTAILRFDVEQIRDKYYELPLSQIHMKEVFSDLFDITLRYHIQIPREFSVLGKTLMTLEGIVESLYPEFNMMSVAEPFAEKVLRERYSPKKIAESAWDHLKDFTESVTTLPQDLKELSSTLKKGKLRLEISTPELKAILEKMDQVSNRLSFSIVLLAFSIVMVGLIIGSSIGRESTILWDFPIIEIGGIVASLMFLWLLYSIFRSGKF